MTISQERVHVPGEWDSEPDEREFTSHGLRCVVRRMTHSGHLCGYVGVTKTHPWYEKHYNVSVKASKELIERIVNVEKIGVINLLCADRDVETGMFDLCLLVDVHGGLTFSSMGKGTYLPKGLWWFGFDCAHCDDLQPQLSFSLGGVYRTCEYVEGECVSLARQLAEIKE